MLSAAIPPVLLRTVYDPSGALFTSSIDKDLLKRLGSYALLSLRALDAYTVAESPVVHLQALFSTSIDHISAILEVDDVMHMTIRCDGRTESLHQFHHQSWQIRPWCQGTGSPVQLIVVRDAMICYSLTLSEKV